jgi:hypothetical protein
MSLGVFGRTPLPYAMPKATSSTLLLNEKKKRVLILRGIERMAYSAYRVGEEAPVLDIAFFPIKRV